jgi:dihydropteroate synthase
MIALRCMGVWILQPYVNDQGGELHRWRFRTFDWTPGPLPLLMGIVNVTPDSFSDGGEFLDSSSAVTHALKLVADGADILDVGGESTRPGAEPVNADEEAARVVPVIQALAAKTDVPISIDTSKAAVARRAIEAGATIVNDISGLTFDEEMPAVCAETEVGVVCMHILGTPQTMQNDPHYDDVVTEVREFLSDQLTALEAAGIPRERVVIDPGIGFGKSAAHNLAILSNIAAFHELSRPVLIGHSRKRFLSKLLGRTVEERTAGTLGVAIALAEQRTDIIRVHDIRATRDALTAWQAVRESSPCALPPQRLE